jgi:HlyD family secretion protein
LRRERAQAWINLYRPWGAAGSRPDPAAPLNIAKETHAIASNILAPSFNDHRLAPLVRDRAGMAFAAAGIAREAKAKPEAASAAAKAALTVTLVQPQRIELAQAVQANGNIAPWQEASVGSESSGWRLAEVLANVGDVVKKGQVLATYAAETAQAELAQGRAAWPKPKPRWPKPRPMPSVRAICRPAAPCPRSRSSSTSPPSARPRRRLDALRAAARVQQLRLAQAQVLAPDHGVISARSATVGAVVGAGQELFRLIRQGRLEWRAEVAATHLGQLKPGQAVRISPVVRRPLTGRVRMVAPTVDAATRNGMVYVDLPQQRPA